MHAHPVGIIEVNVMAEIGGAHEVGRTCLHCACPLPKAI